MEDNGSKANEENSSSAWSRLFVAWVVPLVNLANKKPRLELSDVPPLAEANRLDLLYDKFVSSRTAHPEYSLWRHLIGIIWWPLLISFLCNLLYCASQVVSPLLIRGMITAISNQEGPASAYFVLGIFANSIISAFANNQVLLLGTRMASRLRGVLIRAIYRRILRAPLSTLRNAATAARPTAGASAAIKTPPPPDPATLLSTDVNRFLVAFPLMHNAWGAPLLIILSTYFMYSFLGVSTFAGVAVLCLILPINTCLLRAQAAVQKKRVVATDERNQSTGELLAGMRVVKLNAWEAPFVQRLLSLRAREVAWVRKEDYFFALSNALVIVTPVIAMVATFIAFTFLGRIQDASSTFAALAYFNVIRFPLMNCGTLFGSITQLFVSVERMALFLRAADQAVNRGQEEGYSTGDSDAEETEGNVEEGRRLDATRKEGGGAGGVDISIKGSGSDDDMLDKMRKTATGTSVDLPAASSGIIPVVGGIPLAPPPVDGGIPLAPLPLKGTSSNLKRGEAPPPILCLHRADFGWPHSSGFRLRNFSLSLERGGLLVVGGTVGAGKTSFLLALLGEMPRLEAAGPNEATVGASASSRIEATAGAAASSHSFTQGGLSRSARVSFSPQVPWIESGTLRDNILFNKPLHEARYRAVLTAACLWPDVAALGPFLDLTLIGERGVTLSGGQKARISLARAAYASLMDADGGGGPPQAGTMEERGGCPLPLPSSGGILIADDVLSALDAQTGEAVWRLMLAPGGLLDAHGIARVLVTHSHAVLQSIHTRDGGGGGGKRLLLLHGGTPCFSGAFDQLEERVRSGALDDAKELEGEGEGEEGGGAKVELSGRDKNQSAVVGGEDRNNSSVSGAETAQKKEKKQVGVSAASFCRVLVASASSHSHRSSPPPEIRGQHLLPIPSSNTASVGASATTETTSLSSPTETAILYSSSPVSLVDVQKQQQQQQQQALNHRIGDPNEVEMQKQSALQPEEDRATGSVAISVYWSWLQEGGGWFFIFLLAISFIVERASYIFLDMWLSAWTAAASPSSPRGGLASLASFHDSADKANSISFWLPGYGVLALINAAGATARMFVISCIAAKASSSMLDRALWSVFRSPSAWFDTQPLGRIISRLSYDVDVLDGALLPAIAGVLASNMWILSALVVIVAVVPYILLILAPALLIYWRFQARGRPAMRELRRLDAISRSPLASHVTESAAGAVVIRAFRVVDSFVATLDARLDANVKASIAFYDTSRWLGLWLDLGGSFIQLAVGLIVYALQKELTGGSAALAIMWSMNLVISLNFNIQNTAAAEAAAIAVERLLSYADNLAPEAPLVLRGAGWPLPVDAGFATVLGVAGPSLPPPTASRCCCGGAETSISVSSQVSLAQLRPPPSSPAPGQSINSASLARGGSGDGPEGKKEGEEKEAPPPPPPTTIKKKAPPPLSKAAVHLEVLAASRPSPPWPPRGRVTFRAVDLRYRPSLPLALRGLSFSIPAGAFCCIVGRTGSGKSTIAAALFRLVELDSEAPAVALSGGGGGRDGLLNKVKEGGRERARNGGDDVDADDDDDDEEEKAGSSGIFVDGRNIAHLGLQQLRGSRLAIIPQDPVLFRASVRANLDPFKVYEDSVLWQALKDVRLDAFFLRASSGDSLGSGGGGGASPLLLTSPLPSPSPAAAAPAATSPAPMSAELEAAAIQAALSHPVREDTLSQGQKQLLCLARVLIKQPRLLVLDECTASVDAETDALIMSTVRERLRGCTILCIAHRLSNALTADLVLLLSKGSALELGPPGDLAANKGSAFSQMLAAAALQPSKLPSPDIDTSA